MNKPDTSYAELAEFLVPISESFLVLNEDLLVFLKLVTHFDLDTTYFIELCCLAIELGLERCKLFLLGFKRLCKVSSYVVLSRESGLSTNLLCFFSLLL